jgi:hypothetical protein
VRVRRRNVDSRKSHETSNDLSANAGKRVISLQLAENERRFPVFAGRMRESSPPPGANC